MQRSDNPVKSSDSRHDQSRLSKDNHGGIINITIGGASGFTNVLPRSRIIFGLFLPRPLMSEEVRSRCDGIDGGTEAAHVCDLPSWDRHRLR